MPTINLADPRFEPTDQQLQDLTKRAFADVRERNAQSMRLLRAEISKGRAELQVLLKHKRPR